MAALSRGRVGLGVNISAKIPGAFLSMCSGRVQGETLFSACTLGCWGFSKQAAALWRVDTDMVSVPR